MATLKMLRYRILILLLLSLTRSTSARHEPEIGWPCANLPNLANWTYPGLNNKTELCDVNRQNPSHPRRFDIPGEYQGIFNWVTVKKEASGGTQIPKCWAYNNNVTTSFGRSFEFCRNEGYRLPVIRSVEEQQLLALGHQPFPLGPAVYPNCHKFYKTYWLGMNVDDDGRWEWTDDIGSVTAGWNNWLNGNIPRSNTQFCANAFVDENDPLRSYWDFQYCIGRAVNRPPQNFGTWCQKDMFRIFPCGNCMSRGAAVNFTSTFTCSLKRVRFSNRMIINNNTNQESRILPDVQSILGSLYRISNITLAYRSKGSDNWTKLAKYSAKQGHYTLVLTAEGSASHRRIKASGAFSNGRRVAYNRDMKLTLTQDNMQCNPESTGQVGCWIEYYEKPYHKYPKTLSLVDFTYPARIHDISHTRRISMFDTLNQKYTVRFEMGHADITYAFEILFCNETKQDVPPAWFQSNRTTRNSCTGTGFDNEMYLLTLTLKYTPDMCFLYFAIVYNFESGGSDTDGAEISERYVIEETVHDVRPNCSSDLEKALPYEHLGLAATYGGMVTGITVVALWFLKALLCFCRCFCRCLRRIRTKCCGEPKPKKSEPPKMAVEKDAGETARVDVDVGEPCLVQDPRPSLKSSKKSGESGHTHSSNKSNSTPVSMFKALLFTDKRPSMTPSFVSRGASGYYPKSEGSQVSKSSKYSRLQKSEASYMKTGTGVDGSVKDGGSSKSSKGGKQEPALTLGIDQAKGFIRELSSHAVTK